MSDDQQASNEEGDAVDYDGDDGPTTTTTIPSVAIVDDEAITTTTTTTIAPIGGEDYDDEVLPEVTINLYINELPAGETLPPDLVNAGLTDLYGPPVTLSSTPWVDSVNGYTSTITQEIYDQLNGNGTNIEAKRWWGSWSWHKVLFVGLIALCIIGILLALIFLFLGKRSRKNQRTATGASGTTTKTVQPPTTAGRGGFTKV